MEENKAQKIIFVLPGDLNRVDVIDDILKENGLEESAKEYFAKLDKGEEPRLSIVRDAAMAMAWKKVPEEKIVELLASHLQTSPETSRNIVQELKEKLIPYARIADDETGKIIGEKENVDKDGYDKSNFKDTLLQKVKRTAPQPEPEPEPKEPPKPNLKKPAFQNVEQNAEDWKTKKQPIVTDQRNMPAPPKPVIPTPDNNPVPKKEIPPIQPQQPPMPVQPKPAEKPQEQKPTDPYKEAIE